MFAQITTGKPVRVKSSTGNGKVFEADFMINVKKNVASISNEKEYDEPWRGTEVTAEFKGVSFTRGEQGPGEYIRRTAVANPHAKIIFTDPDKQRFVYERVVSVIPKKPRPAKPHPKGLDVDDLISYAHGSKERTLKTFLAKTFDRVSIAKAKEVESHTDIDFKRKPGSLKWEEADQIVRAIEEIDFLSPSTKQLKPMGEKQVREAILNVLEPEFHSVTTRSPATYRGGVPFIIEAGIAFGGSAGRKVNDETRLETMRFANRAPLLFDAGSCVISKVVDGLDWKRYNIKDTNNTPVTVVVNVTSTYIPYTSAGKTAIASEEEIVKEIGLALMDCARDVKKYLGRKHRAREKRVKKLTLIRYVPEVAKSLSELTGKNKQKIEIELMKLINKKYGDVAVNGEQVEEKAPKKGVEEPEEEQEELESD
jgi:DNA topoisomerase-6 subunit B